MTQAFHSEVYTQVIENRLKINTCRPVFIGELFAAAKR